MAHGFNMTQTPSAGARLVRCCGDCLRIELSADGAAEGSAFVRTNLEKADVRRDELAASAEAGRPVLARDWHDVTMDRVGEGRYASVLPLLEPGIFELKTFFLPEGSSEPVWVPGANVSVKVEPAFTVCSNTIYSAFPRQFGRWRSGHPLRSEIADAVGLLDSEGYSVIPPSGTFRDLVQELDLIVGKMGFRIIQLLPIHPVPTTYARMGRYGSPFAALDFFDVDPALAEFDRRSTPLEQFRELVDAIHARGARVFIDLPANHTGWASHLQVHHPRWFARKSDGTFVSPGAWGVVWEDLCKLDYGQPELWQYMADVFLHWCRQGVDGFRCDAGYMVSLEVWEYITARVRLDFPETLFLLEGLGGPLAVTEKLLLAGNLDWAYSELFQKATPQDVRGEVEFCRHQGEQVGAMVHFAETHDNNRLAAVSREHAVLRTALSALFADAGAYGITNGVEWFADEKLDVHGASNLNWGASPNQVDLLRRLRLILDQCPAFHTGADVRFVDPHRDDVLALLRIASDGDTRVLVLVNLNEGESRRVCWQARDFGADAGERVTDLLAGTDVRCDRDGDCVSCELSPAAVRCLGIVSDSEDPVSDAQEPLFGEPDRVTRQRLRTAALQVARHANGFGGLGEIDADDYANELVRDPSAFARRFCGGGCYAPLVEWRYARDRNRIVMAPPGHLLLVWCHARFRAELCSGDRRVATVSSLETAAGEAFAFVNLPETAAGPEDLTLRMTLFEGLAAHHATAGLILLGDPKRDTVRLAVSGDGLRDPELCGLCTTDLGGMTQARAAWSQLHSKYDALLAANLDSSVPVDRHVLLTRCRAWLVCRGYSQVLDLTCQTAFQSGYDNRLCWDFQVPVGMGRSVEFRIVLRLAREANRVELLFQRPAAEPGDESALPDDTEVTLIVRPDLEDRACHETTEAYAGPETAFPAAVRSQEGGFVFSVSPDRALAVSVSDGRFVSEPEWSYRVHLPFDEQRGLESGTDLFSPGYFRVEMGGGARIALRAEVGGRLKRPPGGASDIEMSAAETSLAEALRGALSHFVVRRDSQRTVIAGYPWFLDWGRDTLIALRGLIASERIDSCRDILIEFASFERDGTLPNMIRGTDDSNRDTSDAPLWLFTAVRDFVAAAGHDILEAPCGGRPLVDVLTSIAENYRRGTPNGIHVDPDSGLVFSPSHFTWMDTNHPAGTPREGYPVEIQALWIAALSFLAEVTGESRWESLRDRARASLGSLFGGGDRLFLSDCLHAGAGTPAAEAVADDANRPNQLLAVTLDAIEDHGARCGILTACAGLLVPGAIRSLDARSVRVELPVYHGGRLLNDPHNPYWGTYAGDEDTRRKPAYHNGTAWTWQFPLYPEALFRTYGLDAAAPALAILRSGMSLMHRGCLGHIPEILDGDAPHRLRGCGAQAWGVSELFRVNKLLTDALEQAGPKPAQT